MLIVFPIVSFFSLCLAAAHFWRGGLWGLATSCLCIAGLAWTRGAWVRLLLCMLLPLVAWRWVWLAGTYVRIREMLGEPWQRLAFILLAVALFTALSGFALLTRRAAQYYNQKAETALIQVLAFLITAAALGTAAWHGGSTSGGLPILVADRFWPGAGLLQAFILAGWAAWVAGSLADRRRAAAVRLRIWRVFSLVFFGQALLGLTVNSLFLMTGKMHLPVPGLILLAPLYRGGGLFMLGLFAASFLLVGTAWCSHLCYFGVWDAAAARRHAVTKPPAWLPWSSFAVLATGLVLAWGLAASGAPPFFAVGSGLVLGLALLPMLFVYTKRWGRPGYCMGICPLGFIVRMAGRLSPWRIRRTAACTGCGACVRACYQGALELVPAAQEPGGRAVRGGNALCTLCRDCLALCPRGGLAMELRGLPVSTGRAEALFIVLITVLHSHFLGMARV